jgi:hypothetical protein
MFPLNLPSLPLDDRPGDSLRVYLIEDKWGRYIAKIFDTETKMWKDEFHGFDDPVECLTAVSRDYPNAVFKPFDED